MLFSINQTLCVITFWPHGTISVIIPVLYTSISQKAGKHDIQSKLQVNYQNSPSMPR